MLGFRCRAVPSIRAAVSTPRSLVNSASPFTLQTKATNSAIVSARSFSSSLFSTPVRPQQLQTFSRLPSTSTPTTLSSVSSLLSQQSQQSRAFSATAHLGVKRNTFNPSRRVQKRRSGFLARNKSQKGRLVLIRRRLRGRKAMSW
ncbi:hypothetical protein N7481_010787 [Penicillium waksmanii]|uniref:uncharacterized protein n=1 Tax=Penicillium waksmanii TaxID=69791 RepID=UPI002549293C|nr:uncharacterized protein N7481_010787 [Penicillium waksmanii]KAJ5973577.1 hypothetical protein N7481_010787 [Penicillium waksmanii]